MGDRGKRILARLSQEPGLVQIQFREARWPEAVDAYERFGRDLLENQYPDITFRWKELKDAISAKIHVLPDLYAYKETRLRSRFRADLCAFALYESGHMQEAVACFLHGALNYPSAARILVGIRTGLPKDQDEAWDHNTGMHMGRALSGYLARRGKRSVRFFKRVLEAPQVLKLLGELERMSKSGNVQRERAGYDRVARMKTAAFARQEAEKLARVLEL